MARGPAQNSRELGNCPETGVWWGLGGNGHVQTHPRDHTIHLGRGIPPHPNFGTISQAKPCFSDYWLWTPGSRRRRGPRRRWGRPAKSRRSKEHCNQIRQNPFRGKLCLGNLHASLQLIINWHCLFRHIVTLLHYTNRSQNSAANSVMMSSASSMLIVSIHLARQLR